VVFRVPPPPDGGPGDASPQPGNPRLATLWERSSPGWSVRSSWSSPTNGPSSALAT
jgi:hypothetical protein